MSQNFANLAPQGRSKSAMQAWEPEEWEAVCLLVAERDIPRTLAADYVRNGIMTLEAYDLSKKKGFVPLNPDEAARKATESLADRGAEFSKKGKAAKSDKPEGESEAEAPEEGPESEEPEAPDEVVPPKKGKTKSKSK